MTATLLQQLWLELDKSIAEGIRWAGVGKNRDPHIENIEEHVEWLEDRVQYLTDVAGLGRGLATAIQIMCQPAFYTTDEVIALAVRRYQAAEQKEDMPATPGFMGPGVSGEMLRQAASSASVNSREGYSK